MTKELQYFSYLKLDSPVVTSCTKTCLKVVPSSVAYDLAGDYFQELRHIIAPAAPMVRQQISSIITPE